jgi:hypothetical protein
LFSEYFTDEAHEGFGDFRMGRQVICTVKYTGEPLLLAKEEIVLQGTVDRLTENRRCHGIENNEGKRLR